YDVVRRGVPAGRRRDRGVGGVRAVKGDDPLLDLEGLPLHVYLASGELDAPGDARLFGLHDVELTAHASGGSVAALYSHVAEPHRDAQGWALFGGAFVALSSGQALNRQSGELPVFGARSDADV